MDPFELNKEFSSLLERIYKTRCNDGRYKFFKISSRNSWANYVFKGRYQTGVITSKPVEDRLNDFRIFVENMEVRWKKS
jgi:hypothetical protein